MEGSRDEDQCGGAENPQKNIGEEACSGTQEQGNDLFLPPPPQESSETRKRQKLKENLKLPPVTPILDGVMYPNSKKARALSMTRIGKEDDPESMCMVMIGGSGASLLPLGDDDFSSNSSPSSSSSSSSASSSSREVPEKEPLLSKKQIGKKAKRKDNFFPLLEGGDREESAVEGEVLEHPQR